MKSIKIVVLFLLACGLVFGPTLSAQTVCRIKNTAKGRRKFPHVGTYATAEGTFSSRSACQRRIREAAQAPGFDEDDAECECKGDSGSRRSGGGGNAKKQADAVRQNRIRKEYQVRLAAGFEKEKADVLGELRDFSDIPVSPLARTLAQLECAAYQALQAAGAGNSVGARSGAQSSADAMVGSAPDGCGSVPIDIPEPVAPEDETPQIQLFRRLAFDVEFLTKSLELSKTKSKKAREERESASSDMTKIGIELKQLEAEPNAPGKAAELRRKREALDKALEALAAADALEKEIDREIESIQGDLANLDEIYSDVQKNPDKAGDYLESLGEKNDENP